MRRIKAQPVCRQRLGRAANATENADLPAMLDGSEDGRRSVEPPINAVRRAAPALR